MSQEEGVLIDIENQNMDQQKNGLEMQTHRSRQSISKSKVFSPTNADNLAKKLRLRRSKSKNNVVNKSALLEDEEGSGDYKPKKKKRGLRREGNSSVEYILHYINLLIIIYFCLCQSNFTIHPN